MPTKLLHDSVREHVEVASLIGDVAEDRDPKPSQYVHLVVGKRDGAAMAGHRRLPISVSLKSTAS